MSEENLNPKKRGLGRGLNALFEDDEVEYSPDGAAEETEALPVETNESVPQEKPSWEQENPSRLGLDQLKPGRYQPRQDFDKDALEQLAQSIRNHGVLQPLLVQKLDDGSYEIVAGERRWRAAQIAQIHDVPVVHVKFDDALTLEVALTENLQRENLGPLEEAYAYQQLMDEFDQTQEQLSVSLGKSRSYIANMVRLLKAPDTVQAALRDGYISVGHARALLAADDPHDLLEKVADNGLSVRQTEKLVAGISLDDLEKELKDEGVDSLGEFTPPKSVSGAQKAAKDPNVVHLEEELSVALGMRVSISGDGPSGTLRIDYKTLDQLDDILARLKQIPGSHKLMG